MAKHENVAYFTQIDNLHYHCLLTMQGKQLKIIQGLEFDCIMECDTTYGVGRWVRSDEQG